MELNINDDVLLLGEANFSFTLSLIKYCDPKFITTSCYESKEEACTRYGSDLVERNLSLLNECKRVLFQIDACNLENHFANETFSRVIFMFPHYSGRSNLKKNRQLIDRFLFSARKVIRFESSVYIALAKGQGGTGFEEDPVKRHNKDSWQILQLAADNGFILTDCYVYNQDKFDYYKSTGFRSQSKSFLTKSGLVHKLELSLPPGDDTISLSNFNYLQKSFKFIQNFDHPLNKLARMISNDLHDFTHVKLNVLNDCLSLNLTKTETNFKISKDLLDYFKLNESQCYLRSSLVDILNNLNTDSNCLNVLNGLVYKRDNYSLFETVEQVNNIEHELLIYYKSQNESFDQNLSQIKQCLTQLVENLLKTCKKNYHLDKIFHFEINAQKQELIILVRTSLLGMLLFDLNDKRLLYSDDLRVIIQNENQNLNLAKSIRAYSVENPKWYHDLSFWFDPSQFDYNEFIRVVRDTCFDSVKSVRMLDLYTEESRQAVCLRLEYESVDRALSWKQTVNLQYKLRDNLKSFNKLVLR